MWCTVMLSTDVKPASSSRATPCVASPNQTRLNQSATKVERTGFPLRPSDAKYLENSRFRQTARVCCCGPVGIS
eukprot:2173680-Prymnesium_polylepis.2